MTGSAGGELTGRVARELAAERQQRAVHLLDGEAIRRALLGCPAVLTELEREAVIAVCDVGQLDRELTAAGLGVSRRSLDDRIKTRRRRVPGLTRDLKAASALRPAAVLVAAVAGSDAAGVASVLSLLSLQQFAALAVVLAAAVSDPSILPVAGECDTGIPTFDDAGV